MFIKLSLMKMMKHLKSGQSRKVLRRKRLPVSTVMKTATAITSGSTVQVLAVLVLNFTTTVVKNTVAVHLTVKLVVIATDSLNSGTLFSHNLKMMVITITLVLQILTLIQVWDLKDLLVLCRMLTISLRLIQSRIL